MRNETKELNEFVDEMINNGPQKTGLMQYLRKHYREIQIMKNSGYTTKQITDFINKRTAAGKIVELNKPVSVVHFNKAWREFCIKKNIPTKPTAQLMQQIEKEILSYRDVVSEPKNTKENNENTEKSRNPTQETAVQLAELIKFLLELLRQSTGKSESQPSGRLHSAASEMVDALDEQVAANRKPIVPASPDIRMINKSRIASFFDED